MRCPPRSSSAGWAGVESWVRCQPSLSDEQLEEWGQVAATWLGTLDAAPPVGDAES